MILIGVISGATIGWAIFSFSSGVKKAMFSTGALGVFLVEFIVFEKNFEIPSEDRVLLFTIFLAFSIITFGIFLRQAFKLLKNQETKYKVHTWEILFGDKKVLDTYYELKNKEISDLINTTHNIKHISEELEKNESLKQLLSQKEQTLNTREQNLKELEEDKQHIVIPQNLNFPIAKRYLDLLPKFIYTISNFNHHLSQFTDDFIEEIDSQKSTDKILKSYLTSLSLFTGEHLFRWSDIRIHFRVLCSNKTEYIKYLAFEADNIEYTDNLKVMSKDTGIINECINSKRSLVKSANLDLHIAGSNDHKWKDYLTMVFDKFCHNGQPVLTMTISVQHEIVHKEFLYLLSYIQIEDIIQSNINRVHKEINIVNTLMKEVA